MATALSTPSAALQTLDNYIFPTNKLLLQQNDPSRIPLVLVACGSFSPITYLHLRMFELARDFAKFNKNTNFEVIGGYMSPVSDHYKKVGLADSHHRLRMCELAADDNQGWLMVDPWEAIQGQYMPTAQVLDHFRTEINKVYKDVQGPDGKPIYIRIALLAGADLVQTMSTPGVWSEEDLNHILGRYGTFIIERNGTDLDEALVGLERWKDNIYKVQQLIANDVSSTKIRMFLRRDMSVQYLIPAPVIKYIDEHGLYKHPGASAHTPSTPGSSTRGKAKNAER